LGSFKISFGDIREKDLPARWGNLYGAPFKVRDAEQGSLMNLYGEERGSHYRGRLLYKVTSHFEREPKSMV
jgi:hypothetical protein